MLDPDSEIRWVLDNKRVFVLKEELGTRAPLLLLLRQVSHEAARPAPERDMPPTPSLSYPRFLRRMFRRPYRGAGPSTLWMTRAHCGVRSSGPTPGRTSSATAWSGPA